MGAYNGQPRVQEEVVWYSMRRGGYPVWITGPSTTSDMALLLIQKRLQERRKRALDER